jgi:O-acetyl-ADP-ribose deacetylase
MRAKMHQTTLELVQGDITQQDVDAIVNAANTSLLGGGGVDGAIHRIAGKELLEATRLLNGCQTGSAKITPGFNLKSRYVIHAVGPIYNRNDAEVPALLASTYRSSLKLAVEHQLASVAFPAISTGAYGYPMKEATQISLQTVLEFIAQFGSLTLVRFVLFDAKAFGQYEASLGELVSQQEFPLVVI